MKTTVCFKYFVNACRRSTCKVIERHSFKILLFLQHGYHTPQLNNIEISAIAFSLHNFKILPARHMEFFGLEILLKLFLDIDRIYVSVTITIISNIIALVSRIVICFG